jgi:heme-degrading monooxygenase HmoA
MSTSPSIVVEIARFEVKEGTDRAAVLEAAQQSQVYVTGCEGFVSRRLCEPTEAEPRWVDIVEWRDLTAAQQAAEGIMASKDCAAFMAVIDERSVSMEHAVAHRIGG